MLYWLFAAISIFFLIVRFWKVQQVNSFAIVCDVMSALFMTITFYFLLFSPNTIALSNSLITQSGTANIAITTLTNVSSNPSFYSVAPQIIMVAVGLYIGFIILMLIFDLFNVYFPKKGQLPRTPGMPGAR